MKKIRYILLLATILILLVGVVSASEASEDNTDTGSTTEEAVTQDTHKVSDTANTIQENKAEENIQTNKSVNKIDKNTIETKTATNTKKEEVITVKSWKQLRDEINKSKNKKENITIKLAKGTYTNTETITWTNNKIVLTIDGNGQTINANKDQAFYVSNKSSLVLKNLTIINGYSDEGGAIESTANLTIIDSTIANTSAWFDGGAIYNKGGYLTIVNSTLTNNFAGKSGGAILNLRGYLTIVNSTLANNKADQDGGAIKTYGQLSIIQSTLANNKADKYGGAIYHQDGYLTIVNSTLSNNKADQDGGAIITEGPSSIIQSTLVNNTGLNGGTIRSTANLTIIDSTIANSFIESEGGAISNSWGYLTIVNSTLTNCSTYYIGGAIFNRGGYVTIVNSTLSNNKAQKGGAIWHQWGYLSITQSTLANNTANLEAGAICADGPYSITQSTLTNNSANHGGAIDNYYQDYSNISSSNFTNNNAIVGGAILSRGFTNLTDNAFTNNTADTRETIDLYGYENGIFNDNVYKSTDISFKSLNLSLKDNQNVFHTSEDVVLNFKVSGLEHPNYYDSDILEQLEGVTIYINGVENVTTKSDNYTLSNLKQGKYEVYYKKANQKSNTITFSVSSITNWQELQEAVLDAKKQTKDTTLYLLKGNYTNTGTIDWYNPKILLTIDGNGQTIDANQLQAFNIKDKSSMILKNITIQNGVSNYGGAIENQGTLTITQGTLTNNTAKIDGGAINNNGKLTITQSTLANNTAKYNGGAIYTYGTLNITLSALVNNTATGYGGAIFNSRSDEYINIVKSNFTNNHAQRGGAILSRGYTNLTGNIFTSNTADNTETIDLNGFWNGCFDTNTYKSTDISLKTLDLRIKNNQTLFKKGEKVVLNYTIALKNPNYYDKDILQRLDDITVYINGVKNVTTKYNDYTLSNLKPGEYTVYITTCNSKSNNVTFTVIDDKMIKLTTWDVEMVRGRGVTFSAIVDYMNTTVNYGKVYFEIDGKALLDENGSVLYAPVMDNRADLPYDMPGDISLGNHTLTAVYLVGTGTQITDNKTLTIIENIPEGAGDGDDEIPSEDGKQGTYKQYTRPHKAMTKYTKTIHSTVTAGHKIITDNNVIPADNVLTLGELEEIFNQTFTNGHLLVYIDGELVFNDTVDYDLTTVILEIIEKFLGQHELKVEFTDADGKKNTYNKTITIE